MCVFVKIGGKDNELGFVRWYVFNGFEIFKWVLWILILIVCFIDW